MSSAMDIFLTQVLPPIGMLMSVAQNASAVYGTYGRLKSQDIRGLYPLPFTLYLGIQQMWFVYGIFTRSVYLTIGAISGVLASTFCMFTIVSCLPLRERIRISCIALLILGLTMAVETIALFASPDQKTANQVTGMVLNVYYCLWTASPLWVMRQVIKKRSADAYVFPLTLSVFINCLVWTGWGIGIMDTTYIFTSAWGMMLSGAQLILVAAFWKNDKLAREARKAAAKAAEASAHEGDAGDDGVCGSLSLSDDGVAVVNVDADLGTGVVDVTACADGHARTPKQKKKRRFGSDSSCAGESNGSDVSPLSLAACEACKEGGCKSQGECGCDKVAIEGQLVGALVGEGVKLDHVVDIDELSESKAAASLSGERGEGDVAPR